MGDCWVAPVPRCPEHGQMNRRPPPPGDCEGTWVCNGWDGEGCDYQAPPPEWKRIGDVADFRYVLTRLPFSSEIGGDS